ncbi:VOC family protein [Beijerinckia indica]|uniref:Glyoxalase/bleomycin resistance protein/dioxygenase n=1 Tax=Beijerinckia indica subsp. indica (strain ATCC 9039 / DSM 1715 / NCIMB 8712) TaxID=395963 RepID=B2IC00_BEII9|nr:VOC family protein [Beijerinckia indica]ACB95255.1 Glyoxalase/bleomycin resistance protein/dioxygenase [Beijerinckia indica subsp. indica ATCC 9039]
MSTTQGTFVWYELMTTDAKAAETFYRDVVGWGSQDAGTEGMAYTLLTVGGIPRAGLMVLPKEASDAGAHPGWIGYVAVDDVDASAAKVSELGGKVLRQPDNIPNIGRFSVVADPQGAAFVLFKGAAEMPSPAPGTVSPGTPGTTGWHELAAGDWEKAFDFYSALFGWTKDQTFDMGPMGTYQLFAHDGAPIGGMMTKPPILPVPFWSYYFFVDSINAAIDRVKSAGGTVTNGPHQVPGGDWIIHGLDPQGAPFALVSRNA